MTTRDEVIIPGKWGCAETLPEDLLVYIFQFLGGSDVDDKFGVDLANIDQVCRSWRRPHGWQCLSLTEVAAQYICQQFRVGGAELARSGGVKHERANEGLVTSTADGGNPKSWKNLLHDMRRCSIDCWCNFCKCDKKKLESKRPATEASHVPRHRYRSLDRRVRIEAITGLCRSCACCLPPLQTSTPIEHHMHYVKVPWEVFTEDSKLTTLFSYKDGWEKKPLWLSPPFWLDQMEWRVMCFPKGVPSGPSGCISLFLECASLCKCTCHELEGGEHHFHTGTPHPEHLDQAPAALTYDSISVSFSLAVIRPEELISGTRVHSVTKEASHNYRFGVPVDSGWRNMVSTAELERCRVPDQDDPDHAAVHIEVRVKVDNIKKNGSATPKSKSLAARIRAVVG